MKKILFLTIISFAYFLTSCDAEFQEDVPVFDPVNGEVILNFTQTQASIQTDGSGNVTLPVEVNVSTVASSDRTYSIALNELETSALANQYTFDSSVTIPAGSHIGSFNVTAVDGTLPTDPVILSLSLVEQGDVIIHNGDLAVSLALNCPIPDGYATGMYELITSIPCEPGDCFGSGVTMVTLVDEGEGKRTFTANYLAQFGIGQPDMTFEFQLFCGNVIVTDGQGTNLQCSDGLQLGSAATPSTYDENDDSVITINFTDDVTDDCAPAGSVQAQITLTKV